MRTIGIGIVGCGEMAHLHARCLSLMPSVRIVASHDSNQSAARALVNEWGGKACLDLESFFSVPELDAVYVLTRTNAHREIIAASLENGKHVFCEKPVARTLEETVEVYNAVRAAGTRFMAGYNLRRTPGVRRLMDELEGERGDRILINMNMAYAPFMDNWLGRLDEGGGAVVVLGSHAFDLLRYIAGVEVEELCCFGSQIRLGDGFGEDSVTASMQFTDGSMATAVFHDNATIGYAYDLGRSMLKLDIFAGKSISTRALTDFMAYEDAQVEAYSYEPYERLRSWGYAAEDRHFVESILCGARPTPDETDGLWAALLVEAARRSMDAGEVVNVQELAAVLAGDLEFEL
jgi:predicted dehydrogenase